MSEWIVYSKDGLTERCSVKSLEYNGEWMGKCNVSVTISSPSPIDFEIGDFLEYRGERFEINYDPSVIKQSSRETYGEGFKYENVIFNSLSDELTRCDFLDYVPSDNQIHYTSLPTFSFFADNIGKLAERIQTNLDRVYKGSQKWTIVVHNEYVNKTNVNITANNITCWDALALVKTEFDANFVIKGRTITIGTEGIAINKLFSYGKGNGLVSIERNAESEQKIITRLRAYGSTKNMPESYYKNLGMKVFFTIGEYSTFEQSVSFYIKTKYNSLNMFTTEWQEQSVGSYTPYKIKVRLNEVAVTAMVALNEGDIDSYINVSSTYEKDSTNLDQFMSDLRSNRYSKLYVESGVVQTAFPYEEREYLDNLPNNMAVRNLMLPSFPENQDPYIDSDNIEILGIREATVFFDGANGLEEIYPTLPSENGINQINSAEQIADDGVYAEGSEIPTFEIYLNDLGFDINDHKSTAGNPIVAMKDGMCGDREFEVQAVESYGTGYKLTCNRSYDDALDLYFPYNGYQIKSGDTFTLLNIAMPDEYVQAASERLLEAAKEYLAKNDYVRYSYIPKVDNVILARQHDEATANGERSIHDTIKEGDLMLFEDDDLRIEGSVIISTLSIKEGEGRIPQYEITLNNEKAVGTFEKIQNQIDSIVSGSTSVKGEGGYNSSQINSMIEVYGSKKFLRKDKDDRSKGKISSDKGFEVGKFEQGTLGTGASMYEGEDKNTYIEADFLKIRKKATFTTISVQELKHVGGEIILSPAAMICSKVEETELGYKCYFNTEDSDGRKIYNEFEVGDFARCQTFNLEHKKYYWRYVSEVEKDYIVLSKFDCDSNSDIPEAGDNISQLGNRYDKERQNAIVLSAYGPDAPSYKQYEGINEYALSEGMLVTKFSPKGNVLKGDFISQSTGKNIEQEFEKVKVDWDKVLSQTDKEFTMWFYEYEPTLDNIPASEWNTDELKALHEQDLFYDLSTGYAYRFEFVDGAYKWNIVTDGETIKALEKAAKAQEAADKVKENLEEIVSDGILSALEKKEVLKEWNTIVSVYPRNIETANKHGLSTSAYTNAYMMLGQYLNGGNTWDGHSIPLWLSETDKNQEINPESYRGYWTDYYDAESEILDAVTGDVDKKADEKKRVFVSQPTPPYEVGDMWVNATYGEYKNDCLVCISRRIQGDLFFISDWRPVSSVTNKVKESIEENIKNLAESAGGSEVYTQNDNPWNSWESGTEWKHVGAIWHCTRNVINTVTKEIIYYEGHTYRYYGYDNTDLWEDITNLVYTSSYFMRNEKQIAGVVGAYDENGNLKENSGFVVTSNFAEIFSGNSKVQAAVQTSVNNGISQATIQADNINFRGKTIINGNFIVTNDGDLRVKADISANTLSLLTKTYGGSMSDYSLGYGSGSFTLPRIDNSNGQLFREVKFLAPNNSRTASNVTVSVYDSGSETILYQDEDGIIKSSSSVSLNVNTLYTFTAIPIESSWFSAEYIWFVSSQELAKL